MAKPFVKWVGGKRQLLPDLLQHLPVSLPALAAGRAGYFEPFLGGGALFFALQGQGLARAVLNDFNPELANLYRIVQAQAADLAQCLATPVFANTPDNFQAVRAWDRQPDWGQRSDLDRAARFVFLNRTAFNGLWRVNGRGHFNTPYGRYAKPGFPSPEDLLAAQQALSVAQVLNTDFEQAVAQAGPGDFVYFDPPYAPVSATASFVGYTHKGFDDAMQRRLAAVCQQLTDRGVAWMLSNSDVPFAREVFAHLDGATAYTVKAARAINRDGAGRGKINELLVVGPVRVA